MRAMQLQTIAQVTPGSQPLVAVDLPRPRPRGHEVLQLARHLYPCARLCVFARDPQDREFALELDYAEHLWIKKQVVTVANITHHDLSAYLPLAAEAGIHPTATTMPLDRANEALCKLKAGGTAGALVLMPS